MRQPFIERIYHIPSIISIALPSGNWPCDDDMCLFVELAACWVSVCMSKFQTWHSRARLKVAGKLGWLQGLVLPYVKHNIVLRDKTEELWTVE